MAQGFNDHTGHINRHPETIPMRTYRQTFIRLLLTFCVISSPTWAATTAEIFQSGAEQIVAGFNARDPAPFTRAIDSEKIIDSALSGLFIGASWKEGFRKGVRLALNSQVGKQIVNQIPEGGYAKLLRIKMNGTSGLALIRVDFGETGNGYMDMHLIQSEDGKIRIIDWFNYATGQLYTESLRQAAAIMSPTPTVLGKVFDIASSRKENSETLLKLMLMHKRGEHAQMVRNFLALDEDLRKSKLLNVVAVQSANILGDMELYGKVLANVERYFGKDESMAFVLLDYYYLQGDYDKVIGTTDRLLSSFGVEDAGLFVVKANALVEMGKNQDAVTQARHAIELEPEYEYAYLSLLSAQIQQEQYSLAVETAKTLENRFSYNLSPQALADNEYYAGFVKSAEYREWRGNK